MTAVYVATGDGPVQGSRDLEYLGDYVLPDPASYNCPYVETLIGQSGQPISMGLTHGRPTFGVESVVLRRFVIEAGKRFVWAVKGGEEAMVQKHCLPVEDATMTAHLALKGAGVL